MTARTPARSAAALTLLAGGCAAALAGCGSGAAHPVAATVQVATSSIAPAPSLSAAHGARSDLTDLSCQADKTGLWSAHGTLTNVQTTTLEYVVVLDVITAADGSVRARAQAEYRQRPGQSVRVDVPDLYRSTAAGLTCVPNVRYGAA
jgi:hypothetical protein